MLHIAPHYQRQYIQSITTYVPSIHTVSFAAGVKARILECGMEFVHGEGRWSISHLLYAEDAVLMARSDSKLDR